MPLELGGVSAWLRSGQCRLKEIRRDTNGDVAVAFVEAADGEDFALHFNVPDRLHDYSARCVVDGALFSSRAIAKDEKQRESCISSVAVTEDGSKQGFRFARTGATAEPPKTALNVPFLPKKAAKSRLGTIRLTLTRCELERAEATSERVSNYGHQASKADHEVADYFCKLSSIRYDKPRKGYRIRTEQEDPWVTFLFVYGSAPLMHSMSLSDLDLSPVKYDHQGYRSPSFPSILKAINRDAMKQPAESSTLRRSNSQQSQVSPSLRAYNSAHSRSSSLSSIAKEQIAGRPPEHGIACAARPGLPSRKSSFLSRLGNTMKRRGSESSQSSLRNEVMEVISYGNAE